VTWESTSEVEIEYCVPCGPLPAAEEVTHALLERFGRQVSELRLLPSHGGVFRVRVGNELVFDKAVSGYDLDEIVRRVSERVRPRGIALDRCRSARDDAG
jgi:selenoprotein W-related protein